MLTSFAGAILMRLDDGVAALERRGWGQGPLAALLLAPALIVLTAFVLGPMGYALYLSLHRLHFGRGPFVGLANYTRALADPAFWDSVLHTVYYAAGTLPAALVFSFLAASGLRRIVRGRGLLRTIYFLPFVTSTVASATVWRVILHNQYGAANQALRALGVPAESLPQWLLEPRGALHVFTGGLIPADFGPSLALVCVIAFEIWRSSGFMIVVLLAGLSAVPREYEDAARIDGAGWWATTRHVTLPLLSPTLLFLTTVGLISAFQAFDAFYALTGDGQGPLNTTRTVTVYIYTEFFVNSREGYGAAMATLLCAAIAAVTVIQWRAVGRRVTYE